MRLLRKLFNLKEKFQVKYWEYLLKRHSVFFHWLLSYVLILLIPIVFGGIINYIAVKTIENEINRANRGMLQQIQLSMDNVFEDINKFTLDLALNPRVQQLLPKNASVMDSLHYTISELFGDFRRSKLTNGYMDDFYIYFKNLDSILSPATYAKCDLMYDILNINDRISYENWYNMLQEEHVRHYIALNAKDSSRKGVRTIAYMQSLPLSNPQEALGTVVVMLNESRLQEMIQSIQDENQCEVMIIDRDNQFLASTGYIEVPEFLRYEKLEEDQGLIHSKWGGEKVTASYISSNITDLKYVTVIPEKIYLQKSKYIYKTMLVETLLCILVGFFISITFSIRNYNPIHEMVKSLSGYREKQSAGEHFNEYQFIRDAIQNALYEKEKIHRKLELQNDAFRSNFLVKLLKGKAGNNASVEDMLSTLDIQFVSGYFAVLLFYITDFGNLFTNSSNPDEELKTSWFIVHNVVEELAAQNHKGWITEVDGMTVCLINFKEDALSGSKEELLRIAREAQKFVEEQFQIQFTVAISGIHQTINRIPKAYEEAFEAMEYKMVMGSGNIVVYEEIASPRQSYNYPIAIEQHLINCIKAGDIEKAREILHEIFESNFSEGSLPAHITKCLMFDLASTILKTMSEAGSSNENLYLQQGGPVERLVKCESLGEMKKLMMNMIEQVCEQISQEKNRCISPVCQKIMEYIKKNYYDLNLNITMIGEQFDMTPTYISKIFKDQTGVGLLDYISQIRVNQAKELLKLEGLNISETAVKVGYVNSNALIRAFKKYEGVTPGQYKDMDYT